MAKDSSKLLYAGDGEVFLAPVGTAMPTDVTAALNVAFIGLGFVAEDGVAISADIASNDVMAWQSPDPIDTRITSRSITIQVGILQFDQKAFQVVFGGGTWTVAAPVSTFAVASGSTTDYYAMIVETTEATKKSRFCFPKVSVADSGELNLRRAEPGNAAVSFRALNTGSGATMTVRSDVVALQT